MTDHADHDTDRAADRAPHVRARPAGFVADVMAIAGRALRAVPRDLEAVIPPIFIALFFFVVNIGTLPAPHREQHPGLRLHGVPDADGDPARRHRRVAGAGARARRAGRLLRPAAAHPGAADRDPARPHGRRRRGGGRAHRADHRRRLRRRRALRDRARSACSCSSCSPRCGAWRSPASATRSRSRPATRRR